MDMKSALPLLRVLAVVNAAVLLSGYVWYRAGGLRAENVETPPSVPNVSTHIQTNESPPNHIGDGAASSELDRDFATPVGKHYVFTVTGNMSGEVFPPAEAASDRDTFVINNCGTIFSPTAKPDTAAAAAPAPAPAERTMIMAGSKSLGAPIFETPVTPAKPQAESAPVRRRMVMPGSKSAPLMSESSEEAPKPAPRALQRAVPVAPQQRTMIMPGSKSSAFDFRSPPAQNYDVDRPVQQAAEPDTSFGTGAQSMPRHTRTQ